MSYRVEKKENGVQARKSLTRKKLQNLLKSSKFFGLFVGLDSKKKGVFNTISNFGNVFRKTFF